MNPKPSTGKHPLVPHGNYQALPLACGVRLFLGSGSLEVTTSSVSCEGFTFLSGISFEVRQQLHGKISVPPYEASADSLTLFCRAHVVRVESHPQGGFKVGCQFDEYFVAPRRLLPNH